MNMDATKGRKGVRGKQRGININLVAFQTYVLINKKIIPPPCQIMEIAQCGIEEGQTKFQRCNQRRATHEKRNETIESEQSKNGSKSHELNIPQ